MTSWLRYKYLISYDSSVYVSPSGVSVAGIRRNNKEILEINWRTVCVSLEINNQSGTDLFSLSIIDRYVKKIDVFLRERGDGGQ